MSGSDRQEPPQSALEADEFGKAVFNTNTDSVHGLSISRLDSANSTALPEWEAVGPEL